MCPLCWTPTSKHIPIVKIKIKLKSQKIKKIKIDLNILLRVQGPGHIIISQDIIRIFFK